LLLRKIVCAHDFAFHISRHFEFLAAKPEVPGSIPGSTRISEYQWVWNGVHSALVMINEQLFERKVAAVV
jgi:hypothetical protein